MNPYALYLQEEEVAAARRQPQQGSADASKAALAALIQNSLSKALSVRTECRQTQHAQNWPSLQLSDMTVLQRRQWW
jgi:hypothetical protein